MGDRVRIVGGSSPPPPPLGEDPYGLIAGWLARVEATAVKYMITTPATIFPTAPTYYHRDYDGLWCWWSTAHLIADSQPQASQALLDYGKDTLEAMVAYNSLYNAGPSETPSGIATGYNNYNLGPYMFGLDPTVIPSEGVDYLQIATNYARVAAYSNPSELLYAIRSGANSFPSPVDNGVANADWDPTRPQTRCREHGRSVMAHMVTDATYSTYESRQYWASPELYFTEGHDLWVPRMIGHLFLGQDVDLSNGGYGTEAYIDHWRSLSADVEAVDGDFTQVPDTWYGTDTSHNFMPFMITHFCVPLILYYEDPSYTGEPHNRYKALITDAITDMCDIFLRWFQLETVDGYKGLYYSVSSIGVLNPSSNPSDLAYWYFPMFAWAYKQTGNLTYYNFAADLAAAGNAKAYIVWGKHFNQFVYQAYWGFQWLGWTATEFKIPWQVDLAGGETWP